MPQRIKTDYPGVWYRELPRIGGKGTERVYYYRFKKNGKTYEEKAGRHYMDNMRPAIANRIRADRIEGRQLDRLPSGFVSSIEGPWAHCLCRGHHC